MILTTKIIKGERQYKYAYDPLTINTFNQDVQIKTDTK